MDPHNHAAPCAAERLPESGFLSVLDQDERCALAALGHFVEFARDADIISQDSQQECLYVLVAGHARVIRETRGREALLAKLRPGELFGEVSILDSRPASATIRAADACTVWRIDRAAFDEFLKANPQAGHRLLIEIARALGRRLRETDKRIEPNPEDVFDGWW
jgi:CRP-like cAMP-binding protein